MPGDPLAGFTESTFTHDGLSRQVFRAGTGPAVIVIHEVPGLHPEVIAFGRRVVDAGFTVFMPSLFGTPGREFGWGYTFQTMPRVCLAREFTTFALDRTSPITGWLRRLAADAHTECGGPGVGAVGISDADFERVKDRAAQGACALGLRFSADPAVPPERFETLRRELGDGFIAVEIDSSRGNPHGIKRFAHSVLTLDLVDEPGHPTRGALDRVLAFLKERLLAPG